MRVRGGRLREGLYRGFRSRRFRDKPNCHGFAASTSLFPWKSLRNRKSDALEPSFSFKLHSIPSNHVAPLLPFFNLHTLHLSTLFITLPLFLPPIPQTMPCDCTAPVCFSSPSTDLPRNFVVVNSCGHRIHRRCAEWWNTARVASESTDRVLPCGCTVGVWMFLWFIWLLPKV